MKHSIRIDGMSRSSKPVSEEIGQIQKSLRKNGDVLLSIEEIAKMANNGTTFIFNSFINKPIKKINKKVFYDKGLMKDEYSGITSCFSLDFDNNTQIDYIQKELAKYSLRANLIYSTFSDSPEHRKLRVIIFLDEPFVFDVSTDELCKEAVESVEAINTTFLEFVKGDYIDKKGKSLKNAALSDDSCKNINRLFYGGKAILHLDTVENSKEVFNNAINAVNHLKATAKKSSATAKNENAPNFEIGSIEFDAKELNTNFDFEKCKQNSELMSAFFNGEYWFDYKQIFKICCSMYWVKGGLKMVENAMQLFNEKNKGIFENGEERQYNLNTLYTPKNVYKYNKKLEADGKYYKESNLSTIAKDTIFEKDIEIKQTIIQNTHFQRGFCEIGEFSNDFISLEVAYPKMEQNIFNFFSTNSDEKKKMTLIKVPTGVGKSNASIEILARLNSSIVYATPTNDLKTELFEKYSEYCKKNGKEVDAICTPNAPQLSKSANDFYKDLQDNGSYGSSFKFLQDIVALKTVQVSYTKSDVLAASEYIKQTFDCFESDKKIFTTHHRALFFNWHKQNSIIFDEDLSDVVIKHSVYDIDELYNNVKGDFDLKRLLREIEDLIDSSKIQNNNLDYVPVKTNTIFSEDLLSRVNTYFSTNTDKSLLYSQLLKFLDSDYFVAQGDKKSFISFSKLLSVDKLKDKNVLILSATLDFERIKTIFQHFKEHSFENIEMKVLNSGKLYQKTDVSNSKTSFKSKKKDEIVNIEEVKQINASNLNVLTHKSFGTHFKNNLKNIYFGNCSGQDGVKGKNIVIYGTPIVPTHIIFLTAALLGYDFENVDTTFKYQTIKYNNNTFKFATFSDSFLQNIHLKSIGSNLEQAIGRARLVRFDATVYLFSSFCMISQPQDKLFVKKQMDLELTKGDIF